MKKMIYCTLVIIGFICVAQSFIPPNIPPNAATEPPDTFLSIIRIILLSGSGVVIAVSGFCGLLFELKKES